MALFLLSSLTSGLPLQPAFTEQIMTTLRKVLLGATAIALMAPSAAQAQITRVTGSDTRQAVTVHLGAFFPTSLDSRVEGDTIFENRSSLLFDFEDFRGFTAGADWTMGLTDYIEVGADISVYRKSVPSIYRSFFNDLDGSEIAQDLKLRMIPVTGSVRFLPLGRTATGPIDVPLCAKVSRKIGRAGSVKSMKSPVSL